MDNTMKYCWRCSVSMATHPRQGSNAPWEQWKLSRWNPLDVSHTMPSASLANFNVSFPCNKCKCNCEYIKKKDLEHFHHARKFPCALCSTRFPLSATTVLISLTINKLFFLVQCLPVLGLIHIGSHSMYSCDWLLVFNLTYWGLVHGIVHSSPLLMVFYSISMSEFV